MCMTQKTEEKSVKRDYKSRMFTMIFKDKKELLSLYNAVNGTHYDNPEELEITTLENAIYMAMKNDLAFILDSNYIDGTPVRKNTICDWIKGTILINDKTTTRDYILKNMLYGV